MREYDYSEETSYPTLYENEVTINSGFLPYYKFTKDSSFLSESKEETD